MLLMPGHFGEGIFKLHIYQRLGNELQVRATHICPSVNVQICLILKPAAVLAQGRLLADQLPLTCRKRPSGVFFKYSYASVI